MYKLAPVNLLQIALIILVMVFIILVAINPSGPQGTHLAPTATNFVFGYTPIAPEPFYQHASPTVSVEESIIPEESLTGLATIPMTEDQPQVQEMTAIYPPVNENWDTLLHTLTVDPSTLSFSYTETPVRSALLVEAQAANVTGIVTYVRPTSTPTPLISPTPPSVPPTATATAIGMEAAITKSPFAVASLLYVDPQNPRYFTNASGRAVYLTGSHTWANFQDIATSNPPSAFDYTAYLNFLQTNKHNFFRLWTWEQSKWIVDQTAPYYFAPSIYQRTGPGNALDGGLKFDVTKFNQAYFSRLRSRVMEAGERGIYVSIMLFDGWSVDYPKNTYNQNNPWNGHPFNPSNNINGIDGDANNDNSGSESHTMQIPAVTALQEAYVRKVIDTVNDLDNVLYEISNESNSNSQTWQYHMIDYVKSYEATKAKQHPVGMTVEYPGGSNSELFSANNHADWVSPNGSTGNYMTDPDAATGNKVIIVDSDHLWGEGGDRVWVWKSFIRGLNVIFMDCYQTSFCIGPFTPTSPTRLSIVANMGYTRNYANRMDLENMTPRTSATFCSTQYCLVKDGMEYLVYRPSGTGNINVNLSSASGQLSYEWFNPATGAIVGTGTVTGGSSSKAFTPPVSGEIVLYIYK